MRNKSQEKVLLVSTPKVNRSLGINSNLHLLRSLSRDCVIVLLAIVGAIVAVAHSHTTPSDAGLLRGSAPASKPASKRVSSRIEQASRHQPQRAQRENDAILGIADLNIERRAHTATATTSGKIMIVGGENADGMVGASEIFEPGSRTFLLAARLKTPRKDHTATELSDGGVLITGGLAPAPIDSTEIFDVAKEDFNFGPPLNRARAGHSATTLKDGRVLIAGGDDRGTAEIFDPETHTFTLLESRLLAPRAFHSAVLLKDGTVLIAGGLDQNKAVVQHGEVFDPDSMSFSVTLNLMRGVRIRPSLRALPDGKVQVIGGDAERSMEIFNPDGKRFTAYARLLARGSKPISQIIRAQTRAGLIHESPSGSHKHQNRRRSGIDELLDRSEHSLTDMSGSSEALLAGGRNGAGTVLKSAIILSSSGATVTTDKTDYVPGEAVTITGSGWLPGETVQLTLQRDIGADDTLLTAEVDQEGRFTNSDYVIRDSDLNVTFVLTAVGQTSLFTAQTTFTDAGPTNPVAQSLPYSQDFSALPHSGAVSDIYPVGWQGWSLANGSSTSFRTSAPTADENLIAGGSASTTQSGVLNYNGKIGFLATGSPTGTDPSLCLAINTTGCSGVMIGFDIMTIRNPQNGATNTRINQVDLQYRIGTTGSFVSVSGSVGGIYQNNSTTQTASGVTTPQNLESKIFALPSSCDNQANVQLRWVQRDLSGAGSRPSFAVDNVSVCSAPPAAAIPAGPLTVCQGQAGVSYSAPPIANATGYVWIYSGTGATINGSTNSITIDFSATSTSGNLTVQGTNSCGDGAASLPLLIAVNPLPAAAGPIAGASSICPGQTGVTYSVPAIAGALSYAWSYTGAGATIVGTANSITIDYSSAATSGDLTVKGTNSCGEGAGSAALHVAVNPPASAPTVSPEICPGATSVSGTSTELDGSAIEVFVNGITVGTTTVNGGSWTRSGLSALFGGDVITATATAPDKCESGSSASVLVPANSAPPVVDSPICSGATGVSGTSTEANGATIEIFVNGISAGTTTVSSGAWTKSNIVPLVAGQVITAKASAADKCAGPSSSGVSVNAPPLVSAGPFSDVCVNAPPFALSTGSPANGIYSGPGVSGGIFDPALAGAGTHQITYAFADANGCTGSATASIKVVALPTEFSVTGGGPYCAGGTGVQVGLSDSEFGIAYQLKRDGLSVGAALSGTGEAISFGNQTMPGTYTVLAINVSTGCAAVMSGGATVIANASPVVTVYSGPPSQSVQYSDAILPVTLKAVDADSSGAYLIASTSWKKSGESFTPGLPSGLTLSLGSTYYGFPGWRSWTITGNASVEPATYVIRLSVIDNIDCSSYVDVTVVVTQEDARSAYTGLACYSTGSSSSNSAFVKFMASVQDITGSTGDPDYDEFGGDIRNARVSFVNRDAPGDSSFSGCANLTPILVDPNDPKTGIVSCTTTLAIPLNEQSASFTVGIVVSNYYTRNDSFDDVIVNLYKPGTGFIGGGGYLINTASAGAYGGTDGVRSNFGFNAKAKTPKVFQGHINIITRRLVDGLWRTYQIKSNAIDSLSIKTTSANTGTGQFLSKANLTDVTDPLNPVSLGGNYQLHIIAIDNGEPGSWDKVGITLWNGSVLLFSSNWSGAPPKTVEQSLGGGNLQVR